MSDNIQHTVRELRERLAAIQSSRTGAATFPAGEGGPPGQPVPLTQGTETENHQIGESQTEEQRDEEQIAKAMCLRLLTDSARTRAQLEQKLERRGISDEVATRVLDRYTELGLIDDQAYAEAYVRSKHRERALSRGGLAAELRRKGVDDTVAATALDLVDTAAEEDRATALVTKRLRSPSAMSGGPDAVRRRLLAMLDRRGYSAEMSIRVVDRMLNDDQTQGVG